METITLTMEEQKRVGVIGRVFRGEVTMAEAALVLGVCERQSYRIKAKINKEGVKGAVFQIPKRSPHLSYAGKKVHVHVLLDGSVEFFYNSERLARFDSKTTHRIGLYRTNGSREVSHYGPKTTTSMVSY